MKKTGLHFFLTLLLLSIGVIAKAQEGIDIYGWSMYNNTDFFKNVSLVKFNSNNPESVERIGAPSTNTIKAGAYAEDGYYAIDFYYTYPKALVKVDLETGETTQIADYMNNTAVYGGVDMSYDFNSSTMYMTTNSPEASSATALLKVNLKDGTQTFVNTNMGAYLQTFAINAEGEAYGVDNAGLLYKVNLSNGTTSQVASLGVRPRLYQSMEFDRNTGMLYWGSYFVPYKSDLCIVNVKTGELTHLGTIGQTEQVVGLYIPFSMADAGAPSAPLNFTAALTSEGSKVVDLSWTNPATSNDDKTLLSIDSVVIYRNNVAIACLTEATPGNNMTWTDNSVTISGTYQYKVIAFNQNGKGMQAKQSLFAGHDLPIAPKNAKASRLSESAISISWNAVSESKENGYMDLASLRYRVLRTDNNTVIAENLSDTSCEDVNISLLGAYSYKITAYNIDGEGDSVVTAPCVTGPAQSLPQVYDFTDEPVGSLWSIYDANEDGNTFVVHYNYMYNQYEFFYPATTIDADDWMISPLFFVEEGKELKAVITAHATNELYTEAFEVYLLSDYSMNQPLLLGTFSTHNVPQTNFRVNLSKLPAGKYNLAVKCVSEKATENFCISKIAIEENHDGNVRGDVYCGDKPIEGVIVSLVDTDFSTITDVEGLFQILNIPAGSYKVRCTKMGYKDSESTVVINELKTTNAELDIEARQQYTLSGLVLNEYNNPMANVPLTLGGYCNYSAVSDANGNYSIDGIFGVDSTYHLSANKAFYQDYNQDITLEASTVENVVMKDKILPPAMISISREDESEAPTLSWNCQGEYALLRYYSNNSYNDYIGAPEGGANQVVGVVYNSPMVLEKVKWMCYTYSAVNLIIVSLDVDGSPSNNVLYSTTINDNMGYIENTFSLPNPIYAPEGCAVLFSCDKYNVMMQLDMPSDVYPFRKETNVMSSDYTTGMFTLIEELGEAYQLNLHIGVEGMMLADTTSPTVSYKIYRALETDDLNLLSSTNDRTYYDTTWDNLAEGTYKYGVTAVYRNGLESTPMCELVQKTGTTAINNISTSRLFDINGRTITLVDGVAINIYTTNGTMVANGHGTINIESLTTGVYLLYLQHGGMSEMVKVIIK